jgi:hypothetical protein
VISEPIGPPADPASWVRALAEALPPRWLETDRGGYTITMRETTGAAQCLQRLDVGAAARSEARIHVGWGSFRNLDLAAARRSAAVLLLDVNRHQQVIWETVAAVLAAPEATSPARFAAALAEALPDRPASRRFNPDLGRWLASDLERPQSWLCAGRPERFAHVQMLFRDGAVAVACADLLDSAPGAAVRLLAEALASAACGADGRPDTLDLSNLPWMLLQRDAFFGADGPAEALAPRRARIQAAIGAIAAPFAHVIAAARETSRSAPASRSWRTELLRPSDLDDALWTRIPRARGAYRALT